MVTIAPPIKCQGIKTKLVSAIGSLAPQEISGRWIEPFCGSGVVAFNLKPERALLCDTNEHIIRLYLDIQAGILTPGTVRAYLKENGERLRREGESVYYEIRDAFNRHPDSLAFLFLNRSCFNGVMRFNRKGRFNVPFCRKPERFSAAYVTKIVNQVRQCSAILQSKEWLFQVGDFRTTLAQSQENDFVYADPPYAGRHVDYYNSWSTKDEEDLVSALQRAPCRFLLSTWYENEFRANTSACANWQDKRFVTNKIAHFYHVGSKESLRHAMTEALITNYPVVLLEDHETEERQLSLFDCQPPSDAMEARSET